ncbi:MAG: type II secretion system F family protein [Pseudomonadota bacterium]
MEVELLILAAFFSTALIIGGVAWLLMTLLKAKGIESFLKGDARTVQDAKFRREGIILGAVLGLAAAGFIYYVYGEILISISAFIALLVIFPKIWVDRQIKKTMEVIERELPDALQVIAGSYKAERTLIECIVDVAQTTQGPISLEFAQLALEARTSGIASALDQASSRLPIQSFRNSAMLLRIVDDRGGNLVKTATDLAVTLRDAQKLKDMTKTATQQSRMTMRVITFAPIAVLAMLVAFQPEGIEQLIGTETGIIITIVSVGLFGIALWIAMRLMDVRQ